MRRIIDVHEVQDELDRAARDVQFGSADVRAGRFVHRAAAADNRASPFKLEPNMPRVKSSMMTRVEYDESTSELDITFTSGKTYRYRDVPPDIYSDLLDAESKGEYFNEHIKDEFEFAEVASRRRR